MVTLLNVRLKRLEVNSVSPCLLLQPPSRDHRKSHIGFIYFEWLNREHRVFYFKVSLHGCLAVADEALAWDLSREHTGPYE